MLCKGRGRVVVVEQWSRPGCESTCLSFRYRGPVVVRNNPSDGSVQKRIALGETGRFCWRTRKDAGLFLVHRAMDEPIILHHCWHREHPLRFSGRRHIREAIAYNTSWCCVQYKMDSVLVH